VHHISQWIIECSPVDNGMLIFEYAKCKLLAWFHGCSRAAQGIDPLVSAQAAWEGPYAISYASVQESFTCVFQSWQPSTAAIAISILLLCLENRRVKIRLDKAFDVDFFDPILRPNSLHT
jgi:hypothetical protein